VNLRDELVVDESPLCFGSTFFCQCFLQVIVGLFNRLFGPVFLFFDENRLFIKLCLRFLYRFNYRFKVSLFFNHRIILLYCLVVFLGSENDGMFYFLLPPIKDDLAFLFMIPKDSVTAHGIFRCSLLHGLLVVKQDNPILHFFVVVLTKTSCRSD